MRRTLFVLCAMASISAPGWAQTPYLSAPASSDAVCAQRCADDRFCHSWRRAENGTCSLSMSVVRPATRAPEPGAQPHATTQLRGLGGHVAPPIAAEPAHDLLGGPEPETQS